MSLYVSAQQIYTLQHDSRRAHQGGFDEPEFMFPANLTSLRVQWRSMESLVLLLIKVNVDGS